MDKKILAVVNGREITEEAREYAMTRFPKERRESFMNEEGKKNLLDEMISWELCYDYAIENEYEQKESYKFEMQEAKKAILTQLTIQDLMSKVVVEDKDVKDYYEQHKDYFKEPEQVTAKHILVDSLEKANEVIAEIKGGLSFEEAVTKYSSCPSKDQGGSLGTFSKGMMVPEFEEAAFKLQIGVISEVVKTQFGYHVILVEEKIAEGLKAFEEVKDKIKGHILQEKQNFEYMNFIGNLKKKYSVEVK